MLKSAAAHGTGRLWQSKQCQSWKDVVAAAKAVSTQHSAEPHLCTGVAWGAGACCWKNILNFHICPILDVLFEVLLSPHICHSELYFSSQSKLALWQALTQWQPDSFWDLRSRNLCATQKLAIQVYRDIFFLYLAMEIFCLENRALYTLLKNFWKRVDCGELWQEQPRVWMVRWHNSTQLKFIDSIWWGNLLFCCNRANHFHKNGHKEKTFNAKPAPG